MSAYLYFLMAYTMRFNILLILFLISSDAMSAEININVSYPDGKPARKVKVQEVGLERGDIHSNLLGVTDSQGKINATIKLKPAIVPNDLKGFYSYAYRYVVMPENFKWEVSDIYWTRFPDINTDSYQRYLSGSKNWSIGKKVKISEDTKIQWNVILRKNPDIKVNFRDQQNEPITNMRLSVNLDLQAQSHTGFGGEISIFDTYTDDKGSITIHNPSNFFYSFELPYTNLYSDPNLNYFSDTVMKRLVDGENIVRFHKSIGKQIEVIVKDKLTGRPVSGANLIVMMDFGFMNQGGPLGPEIITDTNGIYKSDKFYTEHVVEFGVSKEGYKPFLISIDNFLPGSVNEFLLEPEGK